MFCKICKVVLPKPERPSDLYREGFHMSTYHREYVLSNKEEFTPGQICLAEIDAILTLKDEKQ